MLEFVGKDPFRVVGKVQGFVTTERWFGGISVHSNDNVVMRENGLVVREMERDLTAESLTHGEHLWPSGRDDETVWPPEDLQHRWSARHVLASAGDEVTAPPGRPR